MAEGRQTCGVTYPELPLSLKRGIAVEQQAHCLPSLTADC